MESKYSSIKSPEPCHSLVVDDEAAHAFLPYLDVPKPKRKAFRQILPWFIHSALLSISLFLIGSALQQQRHLERECVWRHSFYSPALEAMEGGFITKRINGTFDFPTEWRGEPSPEVDAAWSRITDIGAFSLSETDFIAVDPTFRESAVKLKDHMGGGYMASLEVFHHLHCLNLLRQHTYADYYRTRAKPWEDPPELLRGHVDHCIEILRQKLMCDADVGVLTYNWVTQRKAPWPNFNVQHKCRDFDRALQWGVDHQAPSHGETMEPGPGDIRLVTPP